ncbi:MAG: hypothetical protein KatS3mg055_3025 [Chloroflexus sp.]|uniref:WXG100 family type VII secretion target n=1 Tax=Chloroflexus sp. TaxID=1904827 RepID=UPI0021DB9A4B|nr:WXG100 family type VII secretion target [Chloroflexus sp.]GIV90507.1 MAG: hypothetical protein KatS3mg055_3025 [Chloroflexus sp.]
MALIGADVDALRATVAMFRQSSSQISTAFAQAQQAMQAMQSGPWAGQHRVRAEEIWERWWSQCTPLITELDNLAARTERFADNLEEAGRRFGDETVMVTAHDSNLMSSPPNDLSLFDPAEYMSSLPSYLFEPLGLLSGRLDALINSFEGITSVAGLAAIAIKDKNTRKSIVKTIRKNEDLRKAIEKIPILKSTTKTLLKNKNLLKAANQLEEFSKQSPFGVLSLFAVNFGENTAQAWTDEKYKHDSQRIQKVIADAAIDSVVVSGFEIGGSLAGRAIGGAIGSVGGPLGTALGMTIGGFVGSKLGEWAGEWVTQQEWYEEFKAPMVQAGADMIDKTVETSDQVVRQVTEAGQKAWEQVQSAPAAINNWVNNLLW